MSENGQNTGQGAGAGNDTAAVDPVAAAARRGYCWVAAAGVAALASSIVFLTWASRMDLYADLFEGNRGLLYFWTVLPWVYLGVVSVRFRRDPPALYFLAAVACVVGLAASAATWRAVAGEWHPTHRHIFQFLPLFEAAAFSIFGFSWSMVRRWFPPEA